MNEIKWHYWTIVKNNEEYALVNEEANFYTEVQYLFGFTRYHILTFKTLEEAKEFQQKVNWADVR